MNNQTTVIEKASAFLGKNLNNYQTSYNPGLLVLIERSLNREDFGITNDDFVGYDVWHNYECSFMTNKGYPISVVGKLVIPCNSKFFIESKSMKLYFFSFHMERLGNSVKEATEEFKRRVINDISLRIQAPVKFEVFSKSSNVDVFKEYKDISEFVNVEDIMFNEFKESPNLMVRGDLSSYDIIVKNVRSNCRVTHQPDFANLYVHISGNCPSLESLLKYIVSFRNEFHFHEEVTEQIYKNIQTMFNPEELVVCNLFTRRGGIDINPIRANREDLIEKSLVNETILTNGTIYQ